MLKRRCIPYKVYRKRPWLYQYKLTIFSFFLKTTPLLLSQVFIHNSSIWCTVHMSHWQQTHNWIIALLLFIFIGDLKESGGGGCLIWTASLAGFLKLPLSFSMFTMISIYPVKLIQFTWYFLTTLQGALKLQGQLGQHVLEKQLLQAAIVTKLEYVEEHYDMCILFIEIKDNLFLLIL